MFLVYTLKYIRKDSFLEQAGKILTKKIAHKKLREPSVTYVPAAITFFFYKLIFGFISSNIELKFPSTLTSNSTVLVNTSVYVYV